MQHLLGLGLVVLQAALLGLLSQTYLFPLLIVLIAGVGTFTRLRIPVARDKAFLLSAGAAFFFLLKHRFSPHEFEPGTEFIRTQVAFIIAQYLLTIEAAHFVIRHENNHLSPVLPALGAVALICIADVQISPQQRNITRLFAVTYPLLWGLYLSTCRKPLPLAEALDEAQHARRLGAQKRRQIITAAVLATIAATAWLSSLGLYEFEKKIEGWLVQMLTERMHSSEVGFSRSARLGSLAHQKSEKEQQIALTVVSDSEPGYLRGAVFVGYEPHEWRTPSYNRAVQISVASERPPGLRPPAEGEFLFAHPTINESGDPTWRYLECWVEEDQHSAAFTPLGTTHLLTAADRVGVMSYGLYLLYDVDAGNPYTACVPEKFSVFQMTPRARERFMEVPGDYQDDLQKIASQIFKDARTVAEKIRAVESYFRSNYRYELGIQIPEREDPLLYFLREKPAAHCEYFATATALLLRAGGVPSRYVTGLIPTEWNASGRYWVARNRDAHAWVEAYDEESQMWITVEATPAEGVPAADPAPRKFAWWEALQHDWRRFRTFVAQGRWNQAISAVTSGWLAVPAALLIAAFSVYAFLRIRARWPAGKPKPKPLEPALLEMRKLLERMDRQLQPHGLKRRDGETLHRFADRIRDWQGWKTPAANGDQPPAELHQFASRAAAWYREYAHSLYTGDWDAPTRHRLQTELPRLERLMNFE